MTDRRLTACNGRVADVHLQGSVDAETYVVPESTRLNRNAWLLAAPDGRRDRQALWGDAFALLEVRDGLAFGQMMKDGYVGWLPSEALDPPAHPTHVVAVRTTWAWDAPDFKRPALFDLHMTSQLDVTAIEDGWAVIGRGRFYVPASHLRQPGDTLDVVAAARAFLGTPYVWAGNSGFGIDCSGLVQIAYHAAGLPCPPDSDLQAKADGIDIGECDQLIAGDLIFWRGHVAIATGSQTIIHANAHHMAVIEEPIHEAISRIGATDTGPVTRRLRPEFPPLI